MASGKDLNVTQNVLNQLLDKDHLYTIAAQLDKTSGETKAAFIDVIAAKAGTQYFNEILAVTSSSDKNEKAAAVKSLKRVSTYENIDALLKLLLSVSDDPEIAQYSFINEQAGWIKSNSGPGKKVKIQVTRGYVDELKNSIDIWNAGNGVELERTEELKNEGKDYWFYNGNRPRYGSVILEGTAVDLRVNGWIKYLFNINTWFVWHSTHWTHNEQGPKGRLQQRIFNEPLTFISHHLLWGNGDGVLFYPGTMPHQPEENRGLNRFMPSIRLKNIRRGQQDYELLWLAEKKAGVDKVKALARELVVKAMDEVEMNDKVYWPQNGDAYDAMRNRLLEIIKE